MNDHKSKCIFIGKYGLIDNFPVVTTTIETTPITTAITTPTTTTITTTTPTTTEGKFWLKFLMQNSQDGVVIQEQISLRKVIR